MCFEHLLVDSENPRRADLCLSKLWIQFLFSVLSAACNSWLVSLSKKTQLCAQPCADWSLFCVYTRFFFSVIIERQIDWKEIIPSFCSKLKMKMKGNRGGNSDVSVYLTWWQKSGWFPSLFIQVSINQPLGRAPARTLLHPHEWTIDAFTFEAPDGGVNPALSR